MIPILKRCLSFWKAFLPDVLSPHNYNISESLIFKGLQLLNLFFLIIGTSFGSILTPGNYSGTGFMTHSKGNQFLDRLRCLLRLDKKTKGIMIMVLIWLIILAFAYITYLKYSLFLNKWITIYDPIINSCRTFMFCNFF